MVFLDFNLPNPATWFYLSLMLAVGIYFRFNRFFNLRNWDVLSLYLLVPGFLFLQEALRIPIPAQQSEAADAIASVRTLNRYGFAWLMAGSGWFFLRCMLDMTLVSRPAMIPNLNLAGLAWFGAAMFICMVPVAIRTPSEQQLQVGRKTAAIDVLDKAGTQTVEQVQQMTGKEKSDEVMVGFWVAKTTALLCHLAVVAGLVMIGSMHFQNTTTGMAAGTLYLLLPYTAYHVGQAQHVLPAALMIWALYFYRRPSVAGVLLGLATGGFFFPALTAPIWLSFYRNQGARRFLFSFVVTVAVSLTIAGLFLWWNNELADSLNLTLGLSDWQPWKRSQLPSVWQGIHGAYRLPVFSLHIALVLVTAFWPSPKNLGHVISLTAAVLIGIQFWYADHGGVYALWYLPFLVLMIFRPNLSDRFPPPIPPDPPWPLRQMHRVMLWAARRIRPPEPVGSV